MGLYPQTSGAGMSSGTGGRTPVVQVSHSRQVKGSEQRESFPPLTVWFVYPFLLLRSGDSSVE